MTTFLILLAVVLAIALVITGVQSKKNAEYLKKSYARIKELEQENTDLQVKINSVKDDAESNAEYALELQKLAAELSAEHNQLNLEYAKAQQELKECKAKEAGNAPKSNLKKQSKSKKGNNKIKK